VAKFPPEYLEYLRRNSPPPVDVSSLVCKVQNKKPYGVGIVLEIISPQEMHQRVLDGRIVFKNRPVSLLQSNKIRSYIKHDKYVAKVHWFQRHGYWNRCRFKETANVGWYSLEALMVISNSAKDKKLRP
jgi:hypothetical protein